MVRLAEIFEQEIVWLRRHGSDPAHAGHPFKLLTLTVDIKQFLSADRYAARDWDARPDEALAARCALMRAWNKLHSWLCWRRRQQPTSSPAGWEGNGTHVPFFWVAEFTRHGWPHLHMVLLWRDQISWVDLQTIRSLWKKYGIGTSVDLRNRNWARKGRKGRVPRSSQGEPRGDVAPNPLGLAKYLSKYLGKDVGVGAHRPKSRRWSCSRGFLPPWRRTSWKGRAGYSQADVDRHRAERRLAGAQIEDTAKGFAWSAIPERVPVSSLKRELWESLHGLRGGNSASLEEYRPVGFAFSDRLKLRSGRDVQVDNGPRLFIPDVVGAGIRGSRSRGRRQRDEGL